MKKIILSTLLFTTACLHGIRGISNSTQKAIKQHKAQQLKSEKKALKPLQKNLELLQNQQGTISDRLDFMIILNDACLDYYNRLFTGLCANVENIKKIENQISAIKTKTISEWATLAQRQPKIEKPLKK